MLLTLLPGMFLDNLCKKPPNCMVELHEWVKGYIQMEEMSFDSPILKKRNKQSSVVKW